MRGLGATVSFVMNEYNLVTTRRGYAIKGEMSSVLQFLLALAIILVAAKMGGYLTARLGQPAVLGELLAGVLLGPTALDLLHWFPSHLLEEIFHHLAELGVVVLMFLAGLETKLDDLKSTKNTAILSGTLGVVVPLGFALAVGPLFGSISSTRFSSGWCWRPPVSASPPARSWSLTPCAAERAYPF